MEKWSSKSCHSSRLTSYTIEEKTIEANKKKLNAEEIQTNDINVIKNKRTMSHRNNLRTKNNTLSNTNKIFQS